MVAQLEQQQDQEQQRVMRRAGSLQRSIMHDLRQRLPIRLKR